MEERIKAVMAAVFEVQPESIDENSAPDNIDNWDSLRHMNLIVALEEEFNIRFTDEDISNMLNYKLVKFTLQEKTK